MGHSGHVHVHRAPLNFATSLRLSLPQLQALPGIPRANVFILRLWPVPPRARPTADTFLQRPCWLIIEHLTHDMRCQFMTCSPRLQGFPLSSTMRCVWQKKPPRRPSTLPRECASLVSLMDPMFNSSLLIFGCGGGVAFGLSYFSLSWQEGAAQPSSGSSPVYYGHQLDGEFRGGPVRIRRSALPLEARRRTLLHLSFPLGWHRRFDSRSVRLSSTSTRSCIKMSTTSPSSSCAGCASPLLSGPWALRLLLGHLHRDHLVVLVLVPQHDPRLRAFRAFLVGDADTRHIVPGT